jgi:Mrp family chromosome partitioning ATPase
MSRNFDMPNDAVAQTGPLPRAQPQTDTAHASGSARDRTQAAHDEITRLIHRVFLSPSPVNERKTIAFCGIDSGVGCSWVCARTAELLASQTPSRVCLIDANLRSPALHEYFRTDASPGFAEAMRQPGPLDNFVRSTWTNRLWLMTSGTVGTEPNGALNPFRLHERFTELRNEFDFLLVDVPAIGLYSDALPLGQLSDGIVLVIGSNTTRRESARMAKQNFEDAEVPILGAVLNKRTYPIPEAVYRRL